MILPLRLRAWLKYHGELERERLVSAGGTFRGSEGNFGASVCWRRVTGRWRWMRRQRVGGGDGSWRVWFFFMEGHT